MFDPATIFCFSIIAVLTFLVLVVTRPRNQTIEHAPTLDPEPPSLFTRGMAACIPLSAKTRQELEKELIASGDYRPYALSYFNAQRTMYILLPIITAVALAWVVPEKYVVHIVAAGLVASLMGFSLPRAIVVYRGKQRGRQFDQGLPLAADLMVMCLGAGQTVPHALKRVAGDVRSSKPVIGSELDLASRQADLRNLSFALWQLSDRVQTPNAHNFAMVLAQGEKVGTDTLATLSEFATSLRHSQSLEVEARANRLSFWMLLPTISCLWLAVAMILIGPAWLEMSNIGKIRDEIKRDQMVDITQSSPASNVAQESVTKNP